MKFSWGKNVDLLVDFLQKNPDWADKQKGRGIKEEGAPGEPPATPRSKEAENEVAAETHTEAEPVEVEE